MSLEFRSATKKKKKEDLNQNDLPILAQNEMNLEEVKDKNLHHHYYHFILQKVSYVCPFQMDGR